MSFISNLGNIELPLTAGGVVYGLGSQAKTTPAGTAGQYLVSGGTGIPVFTDLGSLGNQNTAVGTLALASNSTGMSNTAVGNTALYSNTSGNQNTAVGLLAGFANTTGTDNVAIGGGALYSNTVSNGNIAIGTTAMYYANGGSNSTVIGYNAGQTAYGGTNTFLGYNSGFAVTSGANNVIIGGYTGSAAPISATGSNWIVLSDGAGTVRQTISPTGQVTLAGNTIIEVTDNTNAALRVTQLGTGNALLVEDSTNPDATPFVVDANGSVAIGSTTATERLNLVSNGRNFFQMTRASTDSTESVIAIRKARGTNTAPLIVSANDNIGNVQFYGYDGTQYLIAAQILGGIDGNATATNDMPGRLVFSTTADGASAPTERMRIDNAGNVGIGGAANASAILDAQSITKGVRMPNMTTAQKNAIATPAAGLMVFDTTLAKLCVYSGAAWQTITSV